MFAAKKAVYCMLDRHQDSIKVLEEAVLKLSSRVDNLGVCEDCKGLFSLPAMQRVEARKMLAPEKGGTLLYCQTHRKPYDIVERRSKGTPFSGYDVYFNREVQVNEQGKVMTPHARKATKKRKA